MAYCWRVPPFAPTNLMALRQPVRPNLRAKEKPSLLASAILPDLQQRRSLYIATQVSSLISGRITNEKRGSSAEFDSICPAPARDEERRQTSSGCGSLRILSRVRNRLRTDKTAADVLRGPHKLYYSEHRLPSSRQLHLGQAAGQFEWLELIVYSSRSSRSVERLFLRNVGSSCEPREFPESDEERRQKAGHDN